MLAVICMCLYMFAGRGAYNYKAKHDLLRAGTSAEDALVWIKTDVVYGSGIIWELSKHRVLVMTNVHVADTFDDSSKVIFRDGFEKTGGRVWLCTLHDVAFIGIDTDAFSAKELKTLRCVSVDEESYQSHGPGDKVTLIGSEQGPGDVCYDGEIIDMYFFIPLFEDYMMYCTGQALNGMSGGGTFDENGNLVGLISGGNDEGTEEITETVSVPLISIMEAYREYQGYGM